MLCISKQLENPLWKEIQALLACREKGLTLFRDFLWTDTARESSKGQKALMFDDKRAEMYVEILRPYSVKYLFLLLTWQRSSQETLYSDFKL